MTAFTRLKDMTIKLRTTRAESSLHWFSSSAYKHERQDFYSKTREFDTNIGNEMLPQNRVHHIFGPHCERKDRTIHRGPARMPVQKREEEKAEMIWSPNQSL
ncbi:hypothetical protein PoB_004631700 [Plakobranchus ocellatus]|uniref:Uncharacterized protein n=1 Tax=Plakobranchus ocellatus TaxID=259542 RepID=A0AAV4BK89_9GAST|nr:hypothetical protein PoB_004631700 [Plakobranchus ocellatus]